MSGPYVMEYDEAIEMALAPVGEERDEMLEILRGIVNDSRYYKHGIWIVAWEQIEKAKKKVEEWDE